MINQMSCPNPIFCYTILVHNDPLPSLRYHDGKSCEELPWQTTAQKQKADGENNEK